MGLLGDDDKTEAPTGRKLKDAREKGQIARSKRSPAAASLAAGLLVFGMLGDRMIDGLALSMRRTLGAIGDDPQRVIVSGDLIGLLVTNLQMLALLSGPVCLTVMVTVIVVQGAQGGFNTTLHPFQPDLNRLNPMSGIKRLLGQGPIELGITAVSITVIGVIGYQVISRLILESPTFARVPFPDSAWIGWQSARTLFTRAAVAMVVIAAADYGIQRWQTLKQLKMTKQEVKDDNKLSDGNPEIKARIRSQQREAARRRMLGDVARATVVITNPTHFAVAIQYDRETMHAPRVLAKGADKLAARIRELAREHDIALVENKPLAQALYWGAEVGETIPAALFESVAEVLAYLIRLKQLRL
ncbi:MAG: EscU/YscU/HrcU family type III secretion system export apparatus switch protein [Vicinamibacterales bacterium]|nr:EscU/YscU/HrcU family type III secretion system export apparatus switch protein [Vicinamibacterales bacterium]